MNSESQINLLVGALVFNSQLRDTFLKDRLGAIEEYNRNYARRFGQELIELKEEEKRYLLSLNASTLQEVFEALEAALNSRVRAASDLTGVSLQPVNSSAA